MALTDHSIGALGVPTYAPTRTVLSIAGSDPSGGAGIQADLKTFSALGVYGMAVVTALTAQNTRGVSGVMPVPPTFVAKQLTTLLDDIVPDAIKVGMLGSAACAQAVRTVLAHHPEIPVILDPVLVATSGDALADADLPGALRTLLPRVDLITPNLAEASALLGVAVAQTLAQAAEQATALLDLGARRVLVKGGHLAGEASDVYLERGRDPLILTAPRVPTANTHGTGCTLSSAIAAFVALGRPWPDAVASAKQYLTAALTHADELGIGHGHGPVHHFHAQWTPTETSPR